MKLPGPVRWLSLVLSVVLAGAPAIMGVLALTDGALAVGAVYLGVAALMAILPEYVLRRVPGPIEAIKRRLPWSSGDDAGQ